MLVRSELNFEGAECEQKRDHEWNINFIFHMWFYEAPFSCMCVIFVRFASRKSYRDNEWQC